MGQDKNGSGEVVQPQECCRLAELSDSEVSALEAKACFKDVEHVEYYPGDADLDVFYVIRVGRDSSYDAFVAEAFGIAFGGRRAVRRVWARSKNVCDVIRYINEILGYLKSTGELPKKECNCIDKLGAGGWSLDSFAVYWLNRFVGLFNSKWSRYNH